MPGLFFALRTCVHIWQSAYTCALDETLARHGIALIDLDWADCQLLDDDDDHFTWHGFTAFASRLTQVMLALDRRHPNATWTIVSDSTIGYWGEPAVQYLERWFARAGVVVRIDAVSGSGFVAAPAFRSRLPDGSGNVLFIGGWNDAPWGNDVVDGAIRHTVRPRRGGTMSKEHVGRSQM